MTTAAELKTKGNEAFVKKDFATAVSYFSDAIKLTPNDHVLYSNRSGAYASMNKSEEALEDGSKCISLNPSWPKGYSRRGLAEFQLGKIKAAINTYKQGLCFDPNNEALKAALAQAETADPEAQLKGRLPQMIQHLFTQPEFKAYADEDPEFGNKLESILEEIIKDPAQLKVVMSMCPDKRLKHALSAVLGLGQESFEEEDFEMPTPPKTAKKETKENVVQKTPEQTMGDEWKTKGNELYKSKKFEQALEAYDKAILANPNDLLYRVNKAAVYLEMGDFDKCIDECNQALEKQSEVKAGFAVAGKIYGRMAACYRRQQNFPMAIQMYEKSLVEDNSRFTRAALAEVIALRDAAERKAYLNPEVAEEHRLKGNDFFKANNYPAAKKEYDEAIARNPQDARLWGNRGTAYLKLLEYPMALKDVERSLEIDSNAPKMWAKKGTILFRMKDFNKATAAFQSGLAIDPNSAECQKGLEDVMMKVQENCSSTQVDEEQLKHSMADPEIQAILSDPQFRLILNNISEDPKKLLEAMKEPRIADGIKKLMAAGLLKMT